MGYVVKVSGSGTVGGGFSDGIGTNARFNSPNGVTIDSSGNVLVADYYNNRIRILSLLTILPSCDSSWHHLARTHSVNNSLSSSITRFYMDGSLISTSSQVMSIPSHGSSSLYIGWDGLSNYFEGSLSELRLYNRPLLENEVIALSQPPLRSFPEDSITDPKTPVVASSSYTVSCRPGYSGNASLMFNRSIVDKSWSWWTGSSIICEPCGLGSYSSMNGATSCSRCPIGTYSPILTASSCISCPGGTYLPIEGGTSLGQCLICPPSTYSYGGSSGCSSCNAFTSSNLLSSSLGCSPSSTLTSGPSDTSFYLSGSLNEGVSAYVATNLSSLSYVNDYLGALNGALNLTNGGALSITPAIGSSLTLPIGNDEFSMSVWVKCDPPLVQGVSMTVFSYGQENGNNQFAHSINVKSGVGVSTVDSDVGKVITIAGSGSFGYADGEGTNAQFRYPQGIVSDPDGFIYVSDQSSHRIRKISPFGFVSTLAGSGTGAYAEGFGTNAVFNFPTGLCIDAVGNIYVADNGNNRIRLIKPSGIVSTFAGSGTSGFEDGVGTSVKFNGPVGVVISLSRTLYVTDNNNHRIRMISDSGVVSTFAGKSSSGYSDGIGTNAIFSNPRGLAIDASGTLYVTEDSHRIRMITSSGVVTTLAGSGSAGFSDGFRTSALFNFPVSLAIDPSGNIFVGDRDNHRIRMIKPDGYVVKVSGSGTVGSYSDGIGTNARFNSPNGVTIDSSGNVLVADYYNNRIRILSLLTILPSCDSSWHHLARTHSVNNSLSSSITRFYMDGSLISTSSQVMSIPSHGSSSLYIGWDGLSNYFEGSLSELRLYNRPLLENEVIALSQPPLRSFPEDSITDPKTPVVASSSYTVSCRPGYSGNASLMFNRSIVDKSWSWWTGSSIICEPCGLGSYSSMNGATSCSRCPIGTYSPILTASSCISCPGGTYLPIEGGTSLGQCLICPPSTYSYGGSSGCSSCNAFTSSNLLSSSLGCSPSSTLTSGPSDTSFYLSGSLNEGVSAYVATNLSSLSYVNDYLGALNGALNLTNGGALSITPAIGSSLTLPIGNDEFSMSVWVKCDPPLVQGVSMTVFSYGQENGNNQFAHSINVKSGVGVSTVDSDVGKVITIAGSGSFGYADGEGTNAQFRYPQGIVSDPDGIYLCL
jgi:sugar lactone lactonase YvrE